MSKNNNKRVSRREQRRIERAREQRMKMIRTWGPIAVVGLGLLIFIIVRLSSQRELDNVVTVASAPSGQHVADLVYAFDENPMPPMGGAHNPRWQTCGIYDTPVEGQFAVHSMEHGAIWIAYNADLPAEEVETLRDIVRGDEYILLSPYPGLESPIVLTVWDRQLSVESADDDQIERFITAYRRARGPERAASCVQNGIGVPIG